MGFNSAFKQLRKLCRLHMTNCQADGCVTYHTGYGRDQSLLPTAEKYEHLSQKQLVTLLRDNSTHVNTNQSYYCFSQLFQRHYTGCHRRKGPNFGRVFLMLNYTDITQNTYIQS